MMQAILMKIQNPLQYLCLTLSFARAESTKTLRMIGFPLGPPHRNLSNLLGGKLSCQFQGRMDPMPIIFSLGRHIYEVLSIGVPFLGVQPVKLLLQYQSSPIQQSNAKYLFGIGNMLLVPHPVQLLSPNLGHNLLGMGWKLCSHACVLAYSLVSISHSC